MIHTGRHFLQIPGPTNLPDRVLRAMDQPIIDHRGPEFAEMALEVFAGLRTVFKTSGPVVVFPSSGTGAWEAAMVNTLSPGDHVLAFETGQFATLWKNLGERMGVHVEFVPGTWRRGADPDEVEARLKADKSQAIKAVMVVHNETSSGIKSRIAEIRRAMNHAKHPALLMVDTISSLGSSDYRHDEWEVDVSIGGSQKGLMLPPGISFNAISEKALRANKTAKLPRAYWDWEDMLKQNASGFFPYTPPTTLLYGLREALIMLREEGLPNVFARHRRHGEATRAAVRAWGLDIVCKRADEYSDTVTAVFMPAGHDADKFRKLILDKFDMSLGTGLAKLQGKVFRIGHLGHFNDLMLAGTLAGVEMGLAVADVPYRKGGLMAALESLVSVESMDHAVL
jgi:alanine-glyoxylate transaminase / serine-glyoxylate transaminase / serine-pyruvate transaminase